MHPFIHPFIHPIGTDKNKWDAKHSRAHVATTLDRVFWPKHGVHHTNSCLLSRVGAATTNSTFVHTALPKKSGRRAAIHIHLTHHVQHRSALSLPPSLHPLPLDTPTGHAGGRASRCSHCLYSIWCVRYTAEPLTLATKPQLLLLLLKQRVPYLTSHQLFVPTTHTLNAIHQTSVPAEDRLTKKVNSVYTPRHLLSPLLAGKVPKSRPVLPHRHPVQVPHVLKIAQRISLCLLPELPSRIVGQTTPRPLVYLGRVTPPHTCSWYISVSCTC